MEINKIFYSWTQIENMTLNLIRQLQQDDWKPDYLVGLTRGGLLPAKLMSHWYDNVPMHTLNVRLLDGKEEDAEHNFDMAMDAHNDKKILIVDDINDSGATLNWIKNDWKLTDKQLGNNVRLATLINNTASDADVDYFSVEINKFEDPSIWIVFPWEDWWLNT